MRYRVLDLPAKGTTAFTPQPMTNPIASSWGLVHVFGAPGTMPIPVHRPFGAHAINAPDVQGSNRSPDIILPSIYIASAVNMGPAADAGIGMATRRLAVLPVPARGWRASVRSAMLGRRVGARSQLPWPRAFQRFPARTQGSWNQNGA